MKDIVFATSNAHKLMEVKEILSNYNILSLKDIGFDKEIIENGSTFEENSIIKAKTVMEFIKDSNLNYAVLADDSGLCVNALNGEPGVFSARYSGKGTQGNRDLLLRKLTNAIDRSAYFECSATLILPNNKMYTTSGQTHGEITKEELGDTSFGYDCIFYSNDLQKTFGESTPEEKNALSHRAIAMSKIRKILEDINY